MTRNHLRHDGGGNPAAGPPPDLANPSPKPAVGNDFPDRPDQHAGPQQDQPDLDAFAERIGTMKGHQQDKDKGRARSLAETAVSTIARGLDAISGRLSRLAERIRPDREGG